MSDPTHYGRYELLKRLAAGGMAQVWLARQSGMEGFEKLLVVKQVLPHLAGADEFVTMFLDEARLAAQLNHPNVVQVFDLGREPAEDDQETLYIAMEYVHGEDLRHIDRESRRLRNPIPIPLVCRIIADAAGGLHYAHTLNGKTGAPLGIVHRDVSPQNVLVTFDGGVKVVDFGIAKAADRASKTRSGVLKGKYAYMSPEQASGTELDARSDVFALGIMLFELLTGQRLFKRKSEILTLHAVVRSEVPRASSINPIIPADLDPIVSAALSRDVEGRFPSAEAFQLAIEDFLIHLGEPASNAHLAVYMREVFESRLAIEQTQGGPLGYLKERAITKNSGTVGLAGVTPISRAKVGDSRVELDPMALSEGTLGQGQPSAEPGSASKVVASLERNKTLKLAASGIALLGFSFGLGLWLFGRNGESQQPPPHFANVGGEVGTPLTQAAKGVPAGGLQGLPGIVSGAATQATGQPGLPSDPVPQDSAVTPTATDPAHVVSKRGTLQLALRPSTVTAELRIKGKWQRVRSGQRLVAGGYPLRLIHPDGSQHRDTLNLRRGRTTRYAYEFKQGKLRVVITKPFGMGGKVLKGRKLLGRIPGDITLSAGTHALTIQSEDGSRSTRVKVSIKAGRTTKLPVVLE